MFRFTVRDVLWLTVVIALAVGWWIDQDRIRRHATILAGEREKVRLEAQRLQALPLRYAEAVLQVTEAELTAMAKVNQRNPGVVSESDLTRMASKLEAARLDVEKARSKTLALGDR